MLPHALESNAITMIRVNNTRFPTVAIVRMLKFKVVDLL